MCINLSSSIPKSKKKGGSKEGDLSKFSSKIESFSKIPLSPSLFRDSKLTFFETVVEYLKDKAKLKFREIANLLDKDERNIWTIYRRAKKKRGERQ